MRTYIALFRGINVGGKNMLPMRDLTALLEHLGCKSVTTYIQSGNVILQSTGKDRSRLSGKISTEIKKRHGFAPHVMLLTVEELERIIRANPFPEAVSNPKSLHLNVLAAVPARPDLKALEGLRKKNERFHLDGAVLYLHAPDGIGRSKLAANAERLLGVPMTGRNWRTVCKVAEMARAM